jgi:hypothetical protein
MMVVASYLIRGRSVEEAEPLAECISGRARIHETPFTYLHANGLSKVISLIVLNEPRSECPA